MPGFLFAFVAALIAGFGARDQVMVAHLSMRLGARASLLLVAWGGAVVASVLAAWGAATLAAQVPDAGRLLLAAIALAAAGAEALLLRPSAPPAEPTRSLAAIAIVLFAFQLTDSARFLAFAAALATMAPVAAGAGVAAASVVVLGVAALAGNELVRLPMARMRRVAGVILCLAALVVAVPALGFA